VDGRWREVGPYRAGGAELGSRSPQATQASGTPGEMHRRGGCLALLLWEIGGGSFQVGHVPVDVTITPPLHVAGLSALLEDVF
jgi:hypothetical protein